MKQKSSYRCMTEEVMKLGYIPEFRKRLIDAGVGNIREEDFEKIFMDVFYSDGGLIDVLCQTIDNLFDKLIDYGMKSAKPKIFIPDNSLIINM